MIVELGCGVSPSPDADVHHDRTKHSDFVDVAWDLEAVPWPWGDDSVAQIMATDVFEHLRARIAFDDDLAGPSIPRVLAHGVAPWWYWLNECWRILMPDGLLTMRLPSWDNPLSYRDPTHRGPDGAARVFHPETFDYWDPCRAVWENFGRIYALSGEMYWHRIAVIRESGDIRYLLQKTDGAHGAVPTRVSDSPDQEEDA